MKIASDFVMNNNFFNTVGFSDLQSDSPKKVKIILGVGITITRMDNVLLEVVLLG